MSKEIKAKYKKAGLKAPDGKGVHTARAHSCVIEYLKKGFSRNEAWKRCMGGLGRNLAVKKSHWKERIDRLANQRVKGGKK